MSDRLLTIGELARRAGVAASALRYWEELGLLPMAARIAGQRRYPQSAAELVGIILLLRDAGFSLAEQKALMASRAAAPRDAIEHALRCPHQNFLECPTVADVIAARLNGQSLREAHPH
jgi:DNA-binding transcriptional MerR regulator